MVNGFDTGVPGTMKMQVSGCVGGCSFMMTCLCWRFTSLKCVKDDIEHIVLRACVLAEHRFDAVETVARLWENVQSDAPLLYELFTWDTGWLSHVYPFAMAVIDCNDKRILLSVIC